MCPDVSSRCVAPTNVDSHFIACATHYCLSNPSMSGLTTLLLAASWYVWPRCSQLLQAPALPPHLCQTTVLVSHQLTERASSVSSLTPLAHRGIVAQCCCLDNHWAGCAEETIFVQLHSLQSTRGANGNTQHHAPATHWPGTAPATRHYIDNRYLSASEQDGTLLLLLHSTCNTRQQHWCAVNHYHHTNTIATGST